MIKVNIINIEEFLHTVNGCKGAVYMLTPDGEQIDINGQYEVQQQLRRQHLDNKKYLPLILNIPAPSDYMSIINFYVGDL